MLRQLIYISSSSSLDPHHYIEDVLRKARRNNEANGITGILLFTRGTYFQVLEGDAAKVEATFGRIRRNPQHSGVIKLIDRDVATRAFSGWSMAWRHLKEDDPLDGLVTRVIDDADIERTSNEDAVVDTLIRSFLASEDR